MSKKSENTTATEAAEQYVPDHLKPQGLRSYELQSDAVKANLSKELERQTKQHIELENNRAAANKAAKIAAGGVEAEVEIAFKEQLSKQAAKADELANAETHVRTEEELRQNSRIVYMNGVAMRVTGSGPDEVLPEAVKQKLEIEAGEKKLADQKRKAQMEANAAYRGEAPKPTPMAELPKTPEQRIAELEAQVKALTEGAGSK